MAWSAPSSVTTGDLITAATWNQDVVDNVQYMHDNRWYNLMSSGYDSADDYIFDIARASYTFDATNIMWPGSHIDTDDAEVYFWGLLGTSGGTASAILWDNDAGASIVDSWITSASTNPGTMACPVLSGDISANMPTGIVNLQVRYRATSGSELRWNGYGILVVA